MSDEKKVNVKNELLIQEWTLLPKGNFVTLILGIGLCFIGYLIIDDVPKGLSITFIIFGAFMAIVGLLSFFWKNAILHILEAIIFGTIMITFLLTPKVQYTSGRLLFAIIVFIWVLWVIINDLVKFFKLMSIRKKIKKLITQS